jgi:hypothetical protein
MEGKNFISMRTTFIVANAVGVMIDCFYLVAELLDYVLS